MSPQQAVDGSQDAAPKSERASPSAVDAGALSNTETQNKPSETSYTTLPNREIDIESPERAPANSIRDELSAPPMTTSNSSSSHMSHKEGQANGAAGYGTRSRNRPASQRPNYAEDAEMEFEYQHPPAGAPGKEVPAEHTQTSSPSTSARQSPGPLVKRGAAPANGASTSQSKEPNIPGTSTFSANPNAAAPAPTSKKRKAAASANVLNGQSATNGASVASTRKAPSNAHFQPTRESNMYFFDKSKYRLKNGKLESDDGTAFAVDGKSPTASRHPCQTHCLLSNISQ